MFTKLINYLVNDLGINPSAAASIILTLMTFSLGFIINWTASAISKNNTKIKYKRSLKIIIKDFFTSCKKQYLAFEDFTNQKGFLNGSNYTIPIASNFSLNYLSNLDINVFIENFSKRFNLKRSEDISQLFEIIEQVKTNKELLKEQLSLTFLKYSENLTIYNENLDNLRKTHDDLALEYYGKNVNYDSYSYVMIIINIFKVWKENGAHTNINDTLKELVNPMYDHALSVPPNKISRGIVDFCLKCRLAVINIENVENLMKSIVHDSELIHKNAFDNGMAILSRF